MTTLQLVAELAIGVLFAVGAVFNTVYTRRHTADFYGEFAEKAWLGPAGRVTAEWVVPNGKLFTVLLIGFQVAVALAILSRGDLVAPGLVAGGTFAFTVAWFSNVPGAVANLFLAAVQIALALAQ